MQELFEINFDFLGRTTQIKIMIYNEKKDVNYYLDTDGFEGAASFYIQKGLTYAYIFFNNDNYKEADIYSHELLHATKFYLRDHFHIEDEEAECYFLGHLIKLYTDFLNTQTKKEE